MSEDLIRYDILAQEALRGVIRKVLEEVSRAGLPGEHHFFITIQTTHPGVRLSKRMRERYPEEMTIVIQHTFWNLEVGETAFEIDLSFDDVRERLRVPFDAVRGFFDPSVKFGLQFDVVVDEDAKPIEDGKTVATSVPAVNPKSGPPVAVDKAKDAVETADGADDGADDEEADDDRDSADVVSLDSFRKKK